MIKFSEYLDEMKASTAIKVEGGHVRPKYPNFEVGDRVKLHSGDFKGETGKVIKKIRNGVNYRIEHDHGDSWLHHVSHMSKINEEAPANATGGAVAGTTGEPPVPPKNKYKQNNEKDTANLQRELGKI